MKYFYIILLGIVSCVLIVVFIPFPFYYGKLVHLSFDDVSCCMKDMANDDVKYNTIFENKFLSELKKLHETTGAKFTLYVYEEDGNYNINHFPNKYANEFQENSSWLKIGYHVKNSVISKDSIATMQVFQESFMMTDSILDNKFKKSKSDIIRLHYFYATQSEVALMKECGVKCLLCADDNRISYSLSPNECAILRDEEVLEVDYFRYVCTDLRVERDNLLLGIIKNARDKEFVAYTHERCYDGLTKFKFNILVKLLSLYGCDFIN